MLYHSNKWKSLGIGLSLAIFAGLMFLGFPSMAGAQGRGYHPHQFMDARYGHGHAYPSRGHYVNTLPMGSL